MGSEVFEVSIPDEPLVGSAVVVEGRVWVNHGIKNMEWACPVILASVTTKTTKGAATEVVMSAYSSWPDLLKKGKVEVIFRAG